MKVICIKEYLYNFPDWHDDKKTTIGKTYEIQEYIDEYGDSQSYFIADNGQKLEYDSDFFLPIEEHRDNQINKIIEK